MYEGGQGDGPDEPNTARSGLPFLGKLNPSLFQKALKGQGGSGTVEQTPLDEAAKDPKSPQPID